MKPARERIRRAADRVKACGTREPSRTYAEQDHVRLLAERGTVRDLTPGTCCQPGRIVVELDRGGFTRSLASMWEIDKSGL